MPDIDVDVTSLAESIDVNVTSLPEVLNVSFDDYVGSPYSPTVVVTDISGGRHIAITHKTTEGIVTSEFDVLDGYSPTVTIADVENGHIVTITDGTGAHSYFVPDWTDDEERRASAEEARAADELLRVQAEQERASAEETRISNETTRNSNELARSQAETVRSTAEENRVLAEIARANAEAGRVTAENTRVSEWTTKSGEIAAAVNHANQVATDIRTEADRGDYDGVSVTHRWNGTILEVTSASGTSGADLKGDTGETGPQGETGADGFSPTVSVSQITDGHRITITDAVGMHSFDVMDGSEISYELPPATKSTLGGVKVGTGLSVGTDGTLSTVGLTVLEYGKSTWADFQAAYNANKLVYCRYKMSANEVRMAFLAYTFPGKAEFQYYRTVGTKSDTQQGDEVYIYSLAKTKSAWTTTVRQNYTKIIAGTGLTSTYTYSENAGTLTLKSTPATASTLGGVKVGSGLTIDANGVLSLDVPSASGVSF